MVIQVLHLWHIHVVAVSMKIERNNLHFLCRSTGKTKRWFCDERMDFMEQNHWGFEDIVHGWDHQLVLQVSAKRGWKYDRFQKAFRNQLCLGGLWLRKLPVELLPTNGLWSSSKAGRVWMQRKCKAEVVSMDHMPDEMSRSAGPLKACFVYC